MNLIEFPFLISQNIQTVCNLANESFIRSINFLNMLLFSVGSSVFKTFNFFLGARIILYIYEKNGFYNPKFQHKKTVLFLFLLCSFFLSWFSFFIYQLNYINSNVFFPFAEKVANFQVNHFVLFAFNPFFYFVLYMLGIYFFDLSPKKSLKIMRLAYTLLISMVISINIAHMLFPMHLLGHNILGCDRNQDMFMFVWGSIFMFFFYFLVLKSIKKIKSRFEFQIHEDNAPLAKSIVYNFFLCAAVYLMTLSVMCDPTLDVSHLLLLLVLFFAMIYVSIFKDCLHQYTNALNSHEIQIQQLIQSITEFESIKHNFNNILQSYTTYLVAKDYTNLRLYHQKLVDATVLVESNLSIHLRIPENPSFFSLLANKLEKAKKDQVIIQISLLSNMTDLYMEELDLNRILSILLDNAIEAAAETESKRVNFSSHTRTDQSKFFILSNDTINDVDEDKIFTEGYSTKNNHMGQGLPQVRTIVNRYPNVSLHINYYPGIFTVYVDFKPKGGR